MEKETLTSALILRKGSMFQVRWTIAVGTVRVEELTVTDTVKVH